MEAAALDGRPPRDPARGIPPHGAVTLGVAIRIGSHGPADQALASRAGGSLADRSRRRLSWLKYSSSSRKRSRQRTERITPRARVDPKCPTGSGRDGSSSSRSATASPSDPSRETTQPNRRDTEYWATGLTYVYLEGALHRALNPLVRPLAPDIAPPHLRRPAPSTRDPRRHDRKRAGSVFGVPQGRSAAPAPALGAGRLAPGQHHSAVRAE